ncbi:MAG: VanZ family protein [candidate division Zixibacteria bacterium]|nr:VanZ family protein [candidate division Zixibacteria bacterium]
MIETHKKKWRHFTVYHLPMIAYGLIVLGISSIPYLKTPKVRIIAFDKLVHFLEYAVLAALTFRSFSRMGSSVSTDRAFLLSALFVVVFAFLDEMHQYLIPGRDSDPLDFATDLLGAFLVLVYVWLVRKRTRRPKG